MRLTACLFALGIATNIQAATYTVTTSSDSVEGSLRSLVEKANNNPGPDIIEIPAQFNAQQALNPRLGFGPDRYRRENPILVTDDLTIRGLGDDYVFIDDHQRWVSTDGNLNTGYPNTSNQTVVHPSGLMFRVNPKNTAGRVIDFTLENIRFQRMSSLINADSANVTLNNVLVYQVVPNDGADSVLSGSDGTFRIKDSIFLENVGPATGPTFIFNDDVEITGSRFASNGSIESNSGVSTIAVSGNGTTSVVIKDSVFESLYDSSFKFLNANVEISNTLFDGSNANVGWPIFMDSGTLTLTNSTIYYPELTANSLGIYDASHIVLRNNAQLKANNSLLLVTDSVKNVGPLISPSDWDDTSKYPQAENNNNYMSTPGSDDLPNTGLNVAGCKDISCFIPNTLSVSLIDQGDTNKANYGDGTPITADFFGETRPQGASIDIGAFEKHGSLAAYPDTYQVDQDTKLIVDAQKGVLANDTYSPSGIATKVKDPVHGSLVLNSDGSFEYQPQAGYSGNDEFEYEVEGEVAKVTLTVRSERWFSIPDNIPPEARDDNYSVYSDSVDNISAPGVLLNDSDEINISAPFYRGLTARLYSQPSHGSVTMNSDGSFIYTPESGFVGDDSFEYEIFDPNGMHSLPATVRLHVQDGVPHGGKVTVATDSGGSMGLWAIGGLFALLLARRVSGNSWVALLAASLLPLSANADQSGNFFISLKPGWTIYNPDVDHQAWTQEDDNDATLGASVGYQIDKNLAIELSYRWLNSVSFKADPNYPQYQDVNVDYQHINFGFRYRVTQLWGDKFSPYVMAGVGYFNIGSDNIQQVNIENSVHPNFGLGINLFEYKGFNSDISWSHLSGDVDVFELGLSYHFL